MAFEIFGLKPKDGIPKPDEPNWYECSDEEAKAYSAWLKNTKGAFFTNHIWEWHLLWEFIIEVCDDLITEEDKEEGMFSGDHIISDIKAKKIAKKLREVDDDLLDRETAHRKQLDDIPDEACDICEGTGKTCEPPQSGPGEIHCDSCDGKGTQRPFITEYPFRTDNVRAFAEFCEYSGGFKIS